jgi:hypothetical protein
MDLLISDIGKYLENHRTIKGFELIRLEQLVKERFQTIQGYEWFLLVSWSGKYLHHFEMHYGVSIQTDSTTDFSAWLQDKNLKPAGSKF